MVNTYHVTKCRLFISFESRSGRSVSITLGPNSPKSDSSEEGSYIKRIKDDDKRKNRQNSKDSRNSKEDIEDIFGELKMLGKLPLSNTSSIDQEEESLG